jgi:hypothetical protein
MNHAIYHASGPTAHRNGRFTSTRPRPFGDRITAGLQDNSHLRNDEKLYSKIKISKYQPCSTWIQPVFSHILCMMMHLLPALRVAGPFQQYDMAPGTTWTWHDLAISNPNSTAVQQPTEIPTPSTPMTCGVWSASKAPEQFWATGDGRRILETTVGVKWPHSQSWHKLD